MSAAATRIRTFLRLRPRRASRSARAEASIRALEREVDEEEDESARARVVECARAASERRAGAKDARHLFAFDDVFDEDASQAMVFDAVGRDVVEAALGGYNATLFAYGQTGSGKTYTLTGGPARYEDRGIVPRALSLIFERIAKIGADEDAKFTVEVSYVEIYMEQGYDLLATRLDERQSAARGYARASEIPLQKIRLMEDEHGCMHTMDLTTRVVTSEAEALDLLFVGDSNRAVAETPLNMASSRSHCIFTTTITRRSRGADTLRRAKLNLVDLAGSERVNKSRVDGATLQEAKYINVSLHFLEQVIVALQERADGKETIHVPYRNSLMTTMLRDSLGGNCQTVMIATASADDGAFDESVSTCRFAQRVRKISNEVFVNEELDVDMLIARLKEENKRLRVELALLRRAESNEREALELELSADALETLRANVRRYVDEDDYTLDCGSSVAKIRAVQQTLRDMCRRAERGAAATDAAAPPTVSSTTDQAADTATDDIHETSNDEIFKRFCRDVSRVAPTLRRKTDESKALAAEARTLARRMNELKTKINTDRGALDALRIARIIDTTSTPSSRELELEIAVDDGFREHASARRRLERLRDAARDAKSSIAVLKRDLAVEFESSRAASHRSLDIAPARAAR
jgi:kinesin family protein 6/9